jgi:formylglycine-generating enzyme
MRMLRLFTLVAFAAGIALETVGAQQSDEADALFYARWQEDGLDISADEIERGDDFSLLQIDGDLEDEELSAVGGSMILTRFAYELAKERGFKYFIVADPGGEGDLMKVYLVNDTSIPLRELVGDDYSQDLQEVYDDVGYVPVSMFGVVFNNAEPLDRNRPPKDESDRPEMEAAESPAATPTPPGREPGEVREFVGIEFVWIPPGTFEMGRKLSPEELKRRYEFQYRYSWDSESFDDVPRHSVTISRGFWLGRYEVTNEQYRRFDPDHENGDVPLYELDDIKLDHDRQPVFNVSWRDAQRYIRWLNRQGAGTFRLPTEAEWEYACRAGTTSVVYWGDVDKSTVDYAKVGRTFFSESKALGDSEIALPASEYEASAPVGTFKPNAWGLYDMIGNVSEMCQDWYGNYSAESQTDPTGPKSGEERIVRGGNTWTHPYMLHAASRGSVGPRWHEILVGFRLVRVQE